MKAIAVALLLISPVLAQRQDNQERTLSCDGRDNDGDGRHRFCEMRESTLGATGRLVVDSKPNGGISIKGWSRNDVLVRAKVEAWGDSAAEARSNASNIRVEAAGGNIAVRSPEMRNWSVSFEIFAPWRTDVEAVTVNGGVNLKDLEGRIQFTTVNGGVNIARLSGDVKGKTQNGGLKVELDGNHWIGSGLDLQTQNGGVKLDIPASYNASVETGTVNGRLNVDFPVNVPAGRIEQRQLAFNLGSGGSPIKVRTHNGSVSINKR